MKIVCFDLEGTLAPELWVEIAEHFKLPELKITTRDEPDENKLMKARLQTLKSNNVRYSEILKLIEKTKPFDGAIELLNSLPPKMQPAIVTSSYYQFIPPLLEKLGSPFAFANFLEIKNDFIIGYSWRIKDHKRQAVEHFKAQNFEVYAVGDSYNDVPMFEAAAKGFLFRSPDKIRSEYPDYPATDDYLKLSKLLNS
jgi:phosphoserine/homoserine phosphotransferase